MIYTRYFNGKWRYCFFVCLFVFKTTQISLLVVAAQMLQEEQKMKEMDEDKQPWHKDFLLLHLSGLSLQELIFLLSMFSQLILFKFVLFYLIPVDGTISFF